MRLLIVDDSAAWRQRLAAMFSPVEGIEVVSQAQDAPEALALVRALRPEMVILDIQMPGGGGIDVLREVKRDYPKTVVVMLTSHPEPPYRQRCAELGADYFLSKSTGSQLLIEIGEQLAAAAGTTR